MHSNNALLEPHNMSFYKLGAMPIESESVNNFAPQPWSKTLFILLYEYTSPTSHLPPTTDVSSVNRP